MQFAKTNNLCVDVMVGQVIADNIQTTWQYAVPKHATCVLTRSGKSCSAHKPLFRQYCAIGCVDMVVRSPVPPPIHWKGDLKGLCYEDSLVIFVGMSLKIEKVGPA